MSNAQFKSHYSSGNAQFVANYQAAGTPVEITVICNIENGGMSQSSVTIQNPATATPIIYVDRRAGAGNATGGLWRHAAFAVENAEGKTPLFRINRATKDGNNVVHSLWRPVMTTDFVTWTQSNAVTFNGGTSGTYDFSFPNPLPAGRVYIASNLYGTQADAADFANMLLTTYASVASPTLSANSSGVYNTTPAENDDIGRAVGSNPQYAIRLSWPGPTTDGLRKRKLVVFAGIHAAGEQQCWIPFRQSVLWMLNSSSAEAVAIRANWDVYCYFLLNPNGVRGGNSRVTFRNSTDPNRDWANRTLNEIAATYNTVIADTGGTADALFSWHGDVYSTSVFQTWVWTPDYSSGTRGPVMQAMINEGTTIFGSAPSIATSSTDNTDVWFGRSVLGAPVAFDTENAAMRESTVAFFDDVGIKWMRTLQAVDANGLFLANNLTVANCAQTDTSSSGSISLGGIALTGANCDQTDTSSVSVISQLHILVPASSTQGANSGTGVITLTNGNLVAANSTQSDISGTGSISGLPSEASSISSNVFIIWNNIANENSAITHTLGSTASGFPLSNMLNDTKEKVWRSTAGTTQNIQLTWASNRIVNSFALAFTNLVSGSSVRLVLYDATVGGNILYDSGSITIDYNYLDPVGFDSIGVESFAFGGGTHFSRLFEQQDNVRRAVITLVSTSNPDGYIEVSRLVIGQAWQPEYNPDFGLTWDFDETTERVRTDAGNVLLNRGTQNRIVSFNLSHLSVYDKRILTEIIKRNGSHEPVFISILPNDSGELYQSGNLYGRFDKGNIRYSDYSRFYSGIKIEEI